MCYTVLMFIATLTSDDDNVYGVFTDVTVANTNGKDITHSTVYYYPVNDEEAVFAKLTGGMGIGEDPFGALYDLFKTKYVLYKSDMHIVKDVKNDK